MLPHLEFGSLALLLLQIGAVLIVSRLLGYFTRRISQPLVIAEVLAGIALGPSLLGHLSPGMMGALFPAASLDSLRLVSELGLVLFMFLIGLEFDPKVLSGRTHSSVAISYSSIAAPFALGAAVAYWLHDSYSRPGVPFLSFALFLGVAMSVTAFPVLARILSERRLLSTRVGAITLACAAVDDVTAWCLLAFVVAVARASALGQALWTTGLTVAYIALMVFALRPYLKRLGARVSSREGLSPVIQAGVLLLLILSSTLTEAIGIHALFGAFLFGAVLPKGRLAESLAERLETVAVVLLLPLFFAYSGLRTQLGLLDQPQDWVVAAGLIAVATLGKFGGSAVAARLTGLRWREAGAIGILMNTRGLMELIVLNIGMDLGIISPTVFTMLVLMALVTTFATTPILRIVYPDEQLLQEALSSALPASSVQGAPPPGSVRVLACVADGAQGPGLMIVAEALLGNAKETSRVHALHLQRPSSRVAAQLPSEGNSTSDALILLAGKARSLQIEPELISFVSTEPGRDICATAESLGADILLLGAHKPLLFGERLGGTVGEVLAGSRIPVAVLVNRNMAQLRRVLVAFAGGAEDRRALDLARRIGQAPGREVTLLHVVAPDGEQLGRQQIAESFPGPELSAGSVRLEVVEHSDPPAAVLERARTETDLVILGMNRHWGLEPGGSDRRRRILAESPVSVLVVGDGQRT